MALVLVIGYTPVVGIPTYAEGESGGSTTTTTNDTGKWVVNQDGSLNIDETAAETAVKSVTGDVSMVLIGTTNGTITLPSNLGSGVVTKLSNAGDAAVILYKTADPNTSKVPKSTVSAMLKDVKFSSGTTSVNIAVTDGDTSINVSSTDTTFGIVNEHGEAHLYKYIKGSKTWIGAYSEAVSGIYMLGGFKGYLATVTTQTEAELLKKFYDTVDSGNTAGGWVGATSLKYTSNTNISDYSSVPDSKLTPQNHENIASITKETITNGYRIKGSKGAYYWTNKTSPTTYDDYFYWACGPEAGTTVLSSLWNQSGGSQSEPNNSGGECSTVAAYSGTWRFNDFAPTQTVPGYFLEFSVYADGLVTGSTYKSTTIYKVAYDGNSASSGTAPGLQAKFKDQVMSLATNTGNLTKSGKGFNGWNTQSNGGGTHYDAGADLGANINNSITLYAEWVDDPALPPTVTGPGNISLTYGYSAGSGILSVNAVADTTNNKPYSLSYQWYSNTSNSNQDGQKIDGATESTFSIPTKLETGTYYYYCIVTATRTDVQDRKAATSSGAATVTVNKAAGTISFAKSEETKTYGDADFTNTLTNTGDGKVTYSSSNEDVATIDSNGKVTIKQAGSTTITATVADGKNYTYSTKSITYSLTVNKATFTPVVSIDDYTYAGTVSTPGISGNTSGGDVTYYYSTENSNSGGTLWEGITNKSLNAGDYYLYAVVAETTNYVSVKSNPVPFTISKAAGSINYNTTSVTKTFGDAAFTNELTKEGDGTVTYGSSSADVATVDENGEVTIQKTGNTTITATVADGTNYTYSTKTASYDVTINRASINPSVVMNGYTYGGTVSTPSVTGNTENGTVTYYYSKQNSNTNGTEWKNIGSTTLNAGTYYMYATVAQTTNYNTATTDSVQFTVSKAAGSISFAAASVDKVYGNDPFTNTLTKTGDGTVTYSSNNTAVAEVDSNTGVVTIKQAGNATITATVVDGTNYTYETESITYTLNVAKAPASISYAETEISMTYGDAAFTNELTKSGDGTVTYSSSDETVAKVDTSGKVTILKAGTATIKATATAGTNYQYPISEASYTLNVAKKAASISYETTEISKTYGDADFKNALTNTGDGTVTYSSDKTDVATVDETGNVTITGAGEANITATVEDGTNYTYETKTASYKVAVSNADMTVTASDYTATYDGVSHGITVNVTKPVSGATIKYGTSEGTYDLEQNPLYEDVGTYTVYYQVTAPSFNTVSGSKKVIISKKSVWISDITAENKTYDGSTAATLNYGNVTFTGKLEKDSLEVTATGTFDNENVGTGKNVSITGLTLGGTSVRNYVLAGSGHQSSTTASITPKTVGLSWTNTEIIYNGTAQQPTATATELVDGDTCDVIVSGEMTNVGEYTATAESLSNTNYTLPAETTCNFKIVNASMVVSANGYSGVYDGSQHSITVTVTSPEGTTIKYNTDGSTEYSLTDTPSFEEVGTYTVYYQVTKDNYTTVTGSKDVEITNATLTNVSVQQDGTITYDGSAQTPQVKTSAIAVNSQPVSFTYSLSEDGDYTADVPAVTETGTYTVYYKASAPNHSVTPGSFTVTVDQSQINDVTVDIEGWNYGDDPNSPTATATFGIENVIFTYSDAKDGTYTDTVPTEYGTWYVKAAVPGTDNYVGGEAITDFTITKVAPAVTAPTANELTYNGTDQALVTAGSSEHGTIMYSTDGQNFSTDIPTGNAAGEYTVYYKIVGDKNHNDTDVETITVWILEDGSAGVIEPSSEGTEEGIPYTGEEQPLVKPTIETTGTIEYALGINDSTEPGVDAFGTAIPTAKEPGVYYVWYRVVGDSRYDSTKVYGPMIIVIKAAEPTEAEDTSASNPKYCKEWVDGQWYDENGNTGYKPQGSWRHNSKGYWYEDESGWFSLNSWMKIDHKWYFFDEYGYMCTNQYCGKWETCQDALWWVGEDGAWVDSKPAYWNLSNGRWWFGEEDGWYVKDSGIMINRIWYTFDKEGYLY